MPGEKAQALHDDIAGQHMRVARSAQHVYIVVVSAQLTNGAEVEALLGAVGFNAGREPRAQAAQCVAVLRTSG
jgi:hypothetical protein